MQCPHCNQEHSDGTTFCPITGKKIIAPDVCPQCGKPIDPGWLHCGYCGQVLSKPGGRSPKTAWLIIILGIGVLFILALAAFFIFWKGAAPAATSATPQIGSLPKVLTAIAPASAVRSPAPSAQGQVHIADLVEKGLITVNITGVGMDAIALHAQNKSANPLQINIPAGTYFVAKDPASQNMVVRHSFVTSIQPGGQIDITLDAACANLHRNEPGNKDTFSILRTSGQAELGKVIDKLNSSKVDYAVEQAAVWIVTDNASYDELGILVGGSRVGPPLIKENETARAMMLVDQAGVDILKYAVWRDRDLYVQNVTEPDLIAWLGQRGGTSVTNPTPTGSVGPTATP